MSVPSSPAPKSYVARGPSRRDECREWVTAWEHDYW